MMIISPPISLPPSIGIHSCITTTSASQTKPNFIDSNNLNEPFLAPPNSSLSESNNPTPKEVQDSQSHTPTIAIARPNGFGMRSISIDKSLDKLPSMRISSSIADLAELIRSSSCNGVDRLEDDPLTKRLKPEVIDQAVEILKSNDYGGYTIPARGLYPYQWNWDSALVSMGWAAIDERRAWEELEKLFSGQWPDGMVPHIIFHKFSPTYFPGPEVWGTSEAPLGSTGITQPPVAATATRHILERSVNYSYARDRAMELFPKLLSYHRWFYRARDPENTGLVATLHPWETGMDNSPAWDGPLGRVPIDPIPPYTRKDLGHVDAAMRPHKEEYDRYLTLVYRFRALGYDPSKLYYESPFRVTDVCTNSVLHRANVDLRWLAIQLNRREHLEEIDGWIERGRVAFDSLWDDRSRIYRSRDQLTGSFLEAATSAGFMPLYAKVASGVQAKALVKTLVDWLDVVPYGIPSTDPKDARFEGLRYWRGPTWMIVNYMVVDGLRYYGYADVANRVEKMSREVLNTQGLYEYYNPITGKGAGGNHFSWTAAMSLAWLK